MEQSPSQKPPSLSPATSSSDESEYWCHYCDTTALVKTLAHSSQIVCHECNSGFVESISSIAVSQILGEDGDVDDDQFAEENDGESDEEECVIDGEIEDDGEIQEDDGENDDEYEEYGELDDDVDEFEEQEGLNIENAIHTRLLETGSYEYEPRIDLDGLQMAVQHMAAMLSNYDLERMRLQDAEDETDGDGRTGAPPAAETVVSSLKTVDVEVEKDVIHCAVCKDLVSVGEVAKELGCGHGYHEECILPWLDLRNTCPVCRFELPTDDADYEEKRKKKLVGASASGNNPGPE